MFTFSSYLQGVRKGFEALGKEADNLYEQKSLLEKKGSVEELENLVFQKELPMLSKALEEVDRILLHKERILQTAGENRAQAQSLLGRLERSKHPLIALQTNARHQADALSENDMERYARYAGEAASLQSAIKGDGKARSGVSRVVITALFLMSLVVSPPPIKPGGHEVGSKVENVECLELENFNSLKSRLERSDEWFNSHVKGMSDSIVENRMNMLHNEELMRRYTQQRVSVILDWIRHAYPYSTYKIIYPRSNEFRKIELALVGKGSEIETVKRQLGLAKPKKIVGLAVHGESDKGKQVQLATLLSPAEISEEKCHYFGIPRGENVHFVISWTSVQRGLVSNEALIVIAPRESS